MSRRGARFSKAGMFYELKYRQQQVRMLRKKAAALGLQVVEAA